MHIWISFIKWKKFFFYKKLVHTKNFCWLKCHHILIHVLIFIQINSFILIMQSDVLLLCTDFIIQKYVSLLSLNCTIFHNTDFTKIHSLKLITILIIKLISWCKSCEHLILIWEQIFGCSITHMKFNEPMWLIKQ